MKSVQSFYYGSRYGYMPLEEKPVKIPKGHTAIERPKPITWHYSYSNPDSQGALMTETSGFPDSYNPKTECYAAAYSDRLQMWDGKRYKRACDIIGSYEQGWSQALNCADNETIKNFAKEALDLPCLPAHVRVIHYYNVSTGYSCPVVAAIYKKA